MTIGSLIQYDPATPLPPYHRILQFSSHPPPSLPSYIFREYASHKAKLLYNKLICPTLY